ncbi:hypothetical protein IGI42_001716 [Enterococcus sp. AZ109]
MKKIAAPSVMMEKHAIRRRTYEKVCWFNGNRIVFPD